MLGALSIKEIFSVGGLTLLIGIGTTFVVLFLLIFVLLLLNKFLNILDLAKSSRNHINEEFTNNIDNKKLIAAITGAISVILEEENKTPQKSRATFVVKSIKRL